MELVKGKTEFETLFRPVEKALNEVKVRFGVEWRSFEEMRVELRKNRCREAGNRVKRGVKSVIAEPNRLLSPMKGMIVVLLLVGMTGVA